MLHWVVVASALVLVRRDGRIGDQVFKCPGESFRMNPLGTLRRRTLRQFLICHRASHSSPSKSDSFYGVPPMASIHRSRCRFALAFGGFFGFAFFLASMDSSRATS